ncbi:MAG: succinyl-CoA synthetase subunit beta [Pseudomonadota bacterium]
MRRLADSLLRAQIAQGWQFGFILGCALAITTGSEAVAGGDRATARAAMAAFADNCFSPFLTAETARRAFAFSDTTYDFYDLDPFSSAAPSPATTKVTPGTDRRCEIAFAGDYADKASEAAQNALAGEMIFTPAPVPAAFTETDTTTLLAARQLNPRRVAVVHVGTRQGPQGTETFMRVERMTPTKDQD